MLKWILIGKSMEREPWALALCLRRGKEEGNCGTVVWDRDARTSVFESDQKSPCFGNHFSLSSSDFWNYADADIDFRFQNHFLALLIKERPFEVGLESLSRHFFQLLSGFPYNLSFHEFGNFSGLAQCVPFLAFSDRFVFPESVQLILRQAWNSNFYVP